jgi:hypothetical protein
MAWENILSMKDGEQRVVEVGDDEEQATEAFGAAHAAWQARKLNESFMIGGRLSVRAGHIVAMELRQGGPVIA